MPDGNTQPHPTLRGWEIRDVSVGTQWITLHGHRADVPAKLPLVVAHASTRNAAMRQLTAKAKAWDRR